MISEKVFMKGKAISLEKWSYETSQLSNTQAVKGQSQLSLDNLLGAGWFNV